MNLHHTRWPAARRLMAGLILCLLGAALIWPGVLVAQDTPPADDPELASM